MLILKKNINTLTDEEYLSYFSRMPLYKQKEISAYRREEDKKRSVCGYLLALKALSRLLVTNEDNINIYYGENGQPVCNDAFLSITHAGDHALCAVSSKKIGIDAEAKRKVRLNTAFRICTENELKYIFGDAPLSDISDIPEETDEKSVRFLEIWTKKEAYGKMLGKGILYDMKKTDVSHIETYHDGELIVSVVEEELETSGIRC